MRYFNVVVFLLSIIYSALTLPSMIPQYSVILAIFLSMNILGNIFLSKVNIYDNATVSDHGYTDLYLPVFSLLILSLLLISRSFYPESNIYAYVSLFVLHLLFFIFCFITKDNINTYVKAYVIFAFIMSSAGLASFFLQVFDLIDTSSYVNLSELTNGRFTRDSGREDSYLFPYYLGFILKGDGLFNIAGFEFYRISGWAHEPTSATFFVVPAIIILFYSKIFRKQLTRIALLLIIFGFWIFSMAVGSVIVVLGLFVIVTFLSIFRNNFPKKESMFIFISMIIGLPLVVYFLYFYPSAFDLILSKYTGSSKTVSVAINQLTWFVPDIKKTLPFYLSHIFMWVIIFSFFYISLKEILSRRFVDVHSLVLLYLVLHSMKGSQENVFLLLFIFFWFYVVCYGVSSSEDGFKFH